MAIKHAIKGREILKSKERFPNFNPIDYDVSLRKNLFFYNLEVDSKKKKEWALSYWKSIGKNIDGFAKFNDGYFDTVGAVAHMVGERAIQLSPMHLAYLEQKYKDFAEVLSAQKKEPDASSIDLSEKRIQAEEREAKAHIAEFLYGAIDLYFEGKEKFDGKKYLIANNVKQSTIKRIVDELKSVLKEAKSAIAGKDDQLVEGYSFLTRRQLMKYADFLKTLIDSTETAIAITRAARKPRATKVKSPVELVKYIKWLPEDPTLGLKSEHPSKIVGSSEVWLYNAKNRRLFRYVSLGNEKLSVKGMSIINMDPEKSGGKVIRKPEITLKEIQTFPRRGLNKLFESIRGVMSKGVGRLNEDTIIVKCL